MNPFLTSCTLVAGLLLGSGAQAQKKPVPKKPATSQAIVLGTKQLPGDFGKVGTTYTLGKDSPINVTLLGLEYSLNRALVRSGDGTDSLQVPAKGQRWLLVRLNLQNPRGNDLRLWYGSLHLTAVDEAGANHEPIGMTPFTAPGSPVALNLNLKPGQKVTTTIALPVATQSKVVKLLVERERGLPIIRYDTTSLIAPLEAPDTVLGQLNTYFPLGSYDAKLIGLEWSETGIDPDDSGAAGAGKRFLVARLGFRAPGVGRQRIPLAGRLVSAQLATTDGETIARERPLGVGGFISGSRISRFESVVDDDQEAVCRVYFRVPTDAPLKTLDLSLGERTLRFPLTPELLPH